MGHDEDKQSSSKHKRSHDRSERESRSKKRHRSDRDSSRKHKDKASSRRTHIVDDDVNEDDMWVEKNIDMEGERPPATDIPTAESLKLTSHASLPTEDTQPPRAITSESALKRDEWMLMPPSETTVPDLSHQTQRSLPVGEDSLTEGYGEPQSSAKMLDGGPDFFSSLGTERKKRPPPRIVEEPKISHKELNINLKEGKCLEEYPASTPSAVIPGGPGSQWRMMKLRRVYETAEEEGKSVEEIALDRFGSLETFKEVKEERRILDEREGRRASSANSTKVKDREQDMEKRYMFTDISASGASSRSSSFRRPDIGGSTPSTPPLVSLGNRPSKGRFDSLRLPSQGGTGSPLAQSLTPIPSVMTPSASTRARALSPSSLNRLQAKVLRAKLMNAPDTEYLEKEYEDEVRKANGAEEAGVRTRVEVLPTLDAQGRLYDVGQGKADDALLPGNRKKKGRVETRDPKTGELVRINADDDEITLGEMLRQERFGAGSADQKNMDAQLARAIATDGKYENDLDYMDDNVEKLSRQKMRSDAMKRQFAINDYKRTQKVLATCPFCYGEDDSPPKAPIIAMGTRVYLSCTQTEELADGHCLIVPIQHHLTMLEGDDDVWDEVRNFMKCLMRMFAAEDKGVIFYETVISLKWQQHTFIECVPLPWENFEEIPAYFKESILMSETEWSQHKKLIDFSSRPGGFRRAMVPNLPYFMVQFDYKGERGYGHVIEGTDEAAGAGDEDGAIDEGEKGGGEFPRYFAAEIVGNLIGLEPRRWRRPRRVDSHHHKERVAKFRKRYHQYDWTGMIERS